MRNLIGKLKQTPHFIEICYQNNTLIVRDLMVILVYKTKTLFRKSQVFHFYVPFTLHADSVNVKA